MGVDDWFGRERGLGEAEAANLVYAADFDANEIELLELPDDLLQRAREGEELVFKGGPDEEAVLCTSDATYLLKRVETSNTLLLMRGASGAIDDRREDEAEADETDEADATQTPSAATVKRRRVSETSNAGGPVTPVTEPRPARTVAAFAANEDGQPDLIAHAQAESHLELHRTEPRLERAWRALAAPPHAFAGNDEPETTELGLTEETILSLARASKGETLAALEIGPAFLDPATNRWRGVDEGYLDHLLDVLCVAADANGWPLSAVPSIEMCDALVLDGFPKPLTAYAIARFFERVETSDDEKQTEASTFAARAASICAFKAGRLLDAPANASSGSKWRLDAFMEKWRACVPEPFRDDCDVSLLAGLALVEKAAGENAPIGASAVRRLKASSFPREPKARFAALFAVKPRWTLAELTPYVQANAEMTVEAQLLKFTRVTQPDAKATATYSKR
jgi:sister chromatid cohesion protein DCC1